MDKVWDGHWAIGLRRAAPLVLGITLLALLWRDAQGFDWRAIQGTFLTIPAWRWLAAAAATALSFVAIAQYDVIAHGHFDTRVPRHQARNGGAAAMALGQTLGFGPVVGAAVRWRVLPDVPHRTIAALTGFVTLAFFALWAVLLLPVALAVAAGKLWLAYICLPCVLFGTAVVIWRHPRLTLLKQDIAVPSLPAVAKLAVFAALDVGCAGIALYILMPAETAPALGQLLAVYCVALGVGMVGGTPGGVGPFEMALLTLLPMVPSADLAAAVLAYRLVYYALPCVLGAIYVLLVRPAPLKGKLRPPDLIGPRAEIAIASQSERRLVHSGQTTGCLLDLPNALCLFLGPTQGQLPALLPALKQMARHHNKLACLYKITARDAAIARRAGWPVLGFACEAVLDVRSFSYDVPARRQLRRALRKAESAGVAVRKLVDPDWERLTEIHCAWEDRNGPERGVTMGRFCPLYLQDKPLIGAFQDGRLIAFVSAVENADAVSLDLMRSERDVAPGTMHALTCALIDYARRTGRKEACLAAIPRPELAHLATDSAGLTRFKQSFAPQWRPLYVAAPDWLSLALASADIWREMRSPPPLVRSTADLWRLDALIDAAENTSFAPAEEETPVSLRAAG